MTTAESFCAKFALSEEEQQKVLEFIDSIHAGPRQPLIDPYGMFSGHDTSAEEIAEARRELWGRFPREDF